MSAPQDSGGRARVLVSHGRRLRVRTADQRELLAQPAQRQLRAVCGDWVRIRHAHGGWQAHQIEPRTSSLYRSNARGGGELIAANLSLLLVVLAAEPAPELFIVDRYLAAARCAGLEALLVLNKCELPLQPVLQEELQWYTTAGYRVLAVSAHRGDGLPALRAALSAASGMLVGQSGAGKSSLLRALAPDSEAQVGELARDRTGRHTTTTTRLYALPQGGELLDSPGVRDFAPAIERLDAHSLGFVEVERLAVGCRFADCRHLQEPDCAVRAALGTHIGARRYESYRRLRRLVERLGAARPPGPLA